jgi:hypothetical protein
VTYRAPEQSLQKPVADLLQGYDDFRAAVRQRVDSGEWNVAHIGTLRRLVLRMEEMDFDLRDLQRETW